MLHNYHKLCCTLTFLGYQEDQWGQAAPVPGGHQQEDPELTGATEKPGWWCIPSHPFAAPSGWDDWERVRFYSHLQTEISDSISCYMPCKQNYTLWMLMLWDCGWLIFFLLYEKVWNSCECVWWSSAMIMIAFTTSDDLSRFPPSTGERWLMRNWCVSKHTSLCLFLSFE